MFDDFECLISVLGVWCLMLMPDLDQRIFVLPMSILMFIDFEFPISVLGIWETHVCPKSFVFNVLINVSFLLCIWINPFSHLRGPLFCRMILHSICYKTNHFLARSGSAHFQASKQAYAMWASIVFYYLIRLNSMLLSMFNDLIRFDNSFRCRFWCSMTLNLRYRYWESGVLMLMPNLD